MIKILIPLYNDWDALDLLLLEIKKSVPVELFSKLSFVIVDDCSSIPCDIQRFSGYNLSIIRLWRNVSHQKAIALGVSYLTQETDFEKVIVMDSDGEDKPSDIQRLCDASIEEPDKIIFAKRTKRSEGLVFRMGYSIYKLLFGLLTGKVNRQPPVSNRDLGAKYHVSNSVLAVRYGLMSPNATAFAIASCRFLTPSFDSRLLM